MLKSALYRPVWLPAAVAAILLLVALLLLLATAWRSLDRLQPVHTHLTQVSALENAAFDLQDALSNTLRGQVEVPMQEIRKIDMEIARVIAMDSELTPETPSALHSARQSLAGFDEHPRRALIGALDAVRDALRSETRAHGELVEAVTRASETELQIAGLTVIALPLLAMLSLFLFRRRVLVPLRDLGRLMSALAARDYSRAQMQAADPMLRPLFDNYNRMVERLADLEREQEARRESLERQVRSAVHALLAQQRELSDRERLIAVGELAARIAHELRNPLAGMHMALNNLRSEVSDAGQAERLGLVANEIHRINGLLNGLLQQARQEVEPAHPVQLRALVEEVLTLARYQTPEAVHLDADIPPELECALPENGLRQAVLNLLLNARDALGEGPGIVSVRARREADALQIDVVDDGPGLPTELIEGNVRSFRSRRPDGTGLGLAIVERFARDLDGRLELNNLAPRGARITLRLPCKSHHD